MTILKSFEKRIFDILLKDILSPSVLESIKESAELASYESTGNGYFLTIRNPALPLERVVCNKPIIVGTSEGIDSGFVIFLENNVLTLECHSWGDKEIFKNYRDQDVKITTA